MDNTLGSIKRISYLPERASGEEQGDIIGGQNYWDVWITGGSLANVTLTDVTVNGVTTARTERIVTADGDYTVVADDYVITMDKTSDEATTIILPDPATESRSLIIKDGKGDANIYNITLDPGAETIDDSPAYFINSSFGAVELIYNGVQWNVLNQLAGGGGGGSVVGPVTSTNNALVIWNGPTGDMIKDSDAIYNGADLTLDGNVVYRAGGTDVPVADGGTGASTLTGYVVGNGASPMTASATIPSTDITGLGTMAAQNANNVSITGGAISGATVNTPNTGLSILDTNASHSLSIVPGSDLSANRTFTLTTGDANRTLTMAGDATVSGTNTGDQTITLTGEVTGSGIGSFATTVANGVIDPANLTTGGPSWNSNGSTTITASGGNALRVTNTGSGNSLLIEDAAATDSTPFVIDNSGRLIQGHTSAIGTGLGTCQVQVVGSSTGVMSMQGYGSPVGVEVSRASGSVGSPTIVQDGDEIGAILFSGYDGTNGFRFASSISSNIDGTPGANDMPGRLIFSVTPDGSITRTEAMRITNNRGVVLDSATGASQGAGTVNAKGYYVNGVVLPFTKEFISSNQAIPAAAGLLTVTHTLGVAPKIIQLWCICTTTSNGYTAGDAFVMLDAWTNGSNALNPQIYVDNGNTTQINVRMGSGAAFSALVKNTGAATAFTNANFAFIVKAYA